MDINDKGASVTPEDAEQSRLNREHNARIFAGQECPTCPGVRLDGICTGFCAAPAKTDYVEADLNGA